MLIRGEIEERCPPQGFALVIALSLMAFVVMLMLSLSAILRTEVVASAQGISRMQAEQTALLSLNMALGNLQKAAGPDQRITGRAELLVKAVSGGSAATLNPLTDVRAFWTGVALANDASDLGVGADFPDEAGVKVHWLLSGLDPVTGTLSTDAADRVEVYPEGSYLVDTIDANGDAVEAYGPKIEVGLVDVAGSHYSSRIGYFIEDEGIKAKLSLPDDSYESSSAGEMLLPGAFDLSRLDAMSGFTDANGRLSSVGSLNELSMLGLPEPSSTPTEWVLSQRRFNYTFESLGVLSNTRLGGLKQDLSSAFEDDDSFDNLFDDGDQLLVADDKLAQASELATNDYISWKIFRDYYRLKDRVTSDGKLNASVMKMIDGTSPRSDAYRVGYGGSFSGPMGEGPHGFSRYGQELHYVDSQTGEITYNPIKPVLAYFYFETWADVQETPPDEFTATFYMRPWVAYYNPYNVTLQLEELIFQPDLNVAMRIVDEHGTVLGEGDETTHADGKGWYFAHLYNTSYLDDTVYISEDQSYSLKPGELKVLTMNVTKTDMAVSNFQKIMTDDFDNVTVAGYSRKVTSGVTAGFDWLSNINVEVQTYHAGKIPGNYSEASHNEGRPYFLTGARDGSTWRPFQWMVSPFAYDPVETSVNTQEFPGKRIVIENITVGVTGSSSNAANPARFGMWLRTSREPVNQLRPLVDGNIRAAFVNPRWDVDAYDGGKNGLGLRTPVSYSGAPYQVSAVSSVDAAATGSDDSLWGIYTADVGNALNYDNFPFIRSSVGTMQGQWGGSLNDSFSGDDVVLFDVPRKPLVSIGQFQHAEASHFSYEPSYVAGNSYANPRIRLDDWRNQSVRDTFSDWDGLGRFKIPGTFNLYDASYLVNEVLWDDFTFTTLPVYAGADYDDLLQGTVTLDNPRYIPYEPNGFEFDQATLENASDNGVLRNAGFVMADGSFNVNSTSVRAWEAFLSSTAGLPLAQLNANGVLQVNAPWATADIRYPRGSASLGNAADFWKGFSALSSDQIHELALAIVEQVQDRGPFRSLGEFVNRWNPENTAVSATHEFRKSGALQAALDQTVNASLDTQETFGADSAEFETIPSDAVQAAGFPGFVTQGDLLQALAPFMAVRSDTFKIRAVGQSLDPLTGDLLSEVWCEATVQRLPDPVLDSNASSDLNAELREPSSDFGRRFVITNFRWLDEGDVL